MKQRLLKIVFLATMGLLPALASATPWSENRLWAETVVIEPNSQATLTVNIENAEEIVGFQLFFRLPDGFAIAKDEDGDVLVDLNEERKADHSLVTSYDEETNTVGLICVSMNNNTLHDDDSAMVTVALTSEYVNGIYDISYTDIVLVSEDLASIKIKDCTSELVGLAQIPVDTADPDVTTDMGSHVLNPALVAEMEEDGAIDRTLTPMDINGINFDGLTEEQIDKIKEQLAGGGTYVVVEFDAFTPMGVKVDYETGICKDPDTDEEVENTSIWVGYEAFVDQEVDEDGRPVLVEPGPQNPGDLGLNHSSKNLLIISQPGDYYVHATYGPCETIESGGAKYLIKVRAGGTTRLETMKVAKGVAEARDGKIIVNTDGPVEVYTPSGTAVYHGHGPTVDVPAPGIYIVRCGGEVSKICVR